MPPVVQRRGCGRTVGEVVKSQHPNYAVGDIVVDAWAGRSTASAAALRARSTRSWRRSRPPRRPGHAGADGIFRSARSRPARSRGRRWSSRRPRGRSARSSGRSPRSRAAAPSASPAAPKKCAYVTDELGFDACVDYRPAATCGRRSSACPDGIDVYFDNVGGPVTDAVFPNLNSGPASRSAARSRSTIRRRPNSARARRGSSSGAACRRTASSSRFHAPLSVRDGAARRLGPLGQAQYREDIVDGGISKAPEAFVGSQGRQLRQAAGPRRPRAGRPAKFSASPAMVTQPRFDILAMGGPWSSSTSPAVPVRANTFKASVATPRTPPSPPRVRGQGRLLMRSATTSRHHAARAWAREGVDASAVQANPDAFTGIYFVTHDAEGHRFHSSAPAPPRADAAAASAARSVARHPRAASFRHLICHFSECGDTCYAAITEARAAGVMVAFDTNLRLRLWPKDRARAVMTDVIGLADISCRATTTLMPSPNLPIPMRSSTGVLGAARARWP